MPAPPPGVVVMEFFSNASQQSFDAVVGEAINNINCWKMISKAAILEEAKKKGAISDWFPFAKVVAKVKEDDVMLVWCEELEPELQYAEEWFFCATTAARELMLGVLTERAERLTPKAGGGEGGEGGEWWC